MLIDDLERILYELKLLRRMRAALTGLRFVLGRERICSYCRGYGRMASGAECPTCAGAGTFPVANPNVSKSQSTRVD